MLHKKAPTVIRSGKGAARSGSTGEKKAAAAASSRGVPAVPVDTGSMPPMKTTTASSGGSTHARNAKTGLRTEKMPWNSSTKVKKPDIIRSGGQTTITAKDSEQSAAKHRTTKGKPRTGTVSSAKMPQKHCKKDKADTGSKVDVDTGSSGDTLHGHPAKEESLDDPEIRLLIEELDGLGENISDEGCVDYIHQLARKPRLGPKFEMEDEDQDNQDCVLALYRFRYYKYKLSQQVSKKKLHADKLKDDYPVNLLEEEEEEEGTKLEKDCIQDIAEKDCSAEFLRMQSYFEPFEKDSTLGWFFHPDYIYRNNLNDYQRLVIRNYGNYEYANWSDYHEALNSYETEREYVKYYEKLSEELKWMENYIHIERSSLKWDIISCKGLYQAIKIAATSFTKITVALAYSAYYEFKDSRAYDIIWFRELDGVYFEIWQRITEQKMSFKAALEEVYNLNKFPFRQRSMKRALQFDLTLKEFEQKFNTCMASITPDVKKDKIPLEWIAEAVKKRVDKPKTYDQYIRKKIHIAHTIRIPGIEAII